ncbi:hypothetical protein L3X38_024707 [Prunus dulcis]|uniref:Integrase zinc-binding domain-containing protein n=1 Tax=Prunus dulcis TaxID=3755 RepID=A0AAD4W0B4_PRUDU|nr:hypothetical protein L3X38_024707 [Prunus dulcis]
MLVELRIQFVEILGDSMLVLKQIAGEYKCLNPSLAVYLVAARNLLTEFREATWEHIPREETGIQVPEDCVQRIIKVGKKSLSFVLTRGMEIDVNFAIITKDDWRTPIINYFQYPTLPSEKRIRITALNYLMWNEDLVRKSKDELLLRCLGKKEYMKVMGETHEGICGAHHGGRRYASFWLIRRYAYFWPTMMKDCIEYSKGCEACQRYSPIQQAPSVPMNPVVKPWPFRGWAMDLIDKIYLASSKQYCFIIVATDYFTKWVEAKPVICAPLLLPIELAATTGHDDLRHRYRRLRLAVAVLSRPVSASAPTGARRNQAKTDRFSPDFQTSRSPSFLNQIVQVKYGFSPIFRALAGGWIGFDRF